MKVYEDYYHELFNELPDDAERVMNDTVSWLEVHLPGKVTTAESS